MLLISYWLMCVCNLFIYHMNVSLLCKVCDKHIYIRTNEFVQFSISKFSVEKQLSGRSKTTETDSLNRFCFFFFLFITCNEYIHAQKTTATNENKVNISTCLSSFGGRPMACLQYTHGYVNKYTKRIYGIVSAECIVRYSYTYSILVYESRTQKFTAGYVIAIEHRHHRRR